MGMGVEGGRGSGGRVGGSEWGWGWGVGWGRESNLNLKGQNYVYKVLAREKLRSLLNSLIMYYYDK